MKATPTAQEFSEEVERFFLQVCRASGSKSAHIGVAATLEGVAIAFRRMGVILQPTDTDLDPEYWRGSSDYWHKCADLVDELVGKVG